MARSRKKPTTTSPPSPSGPVFFLVRRLYELNWATIFANSTVALAYEQPTQHCWGGPIRAFSTREAAWVEAHQRNDQLLSQLQNTNLLTLIGQHWSDISSRSVQEFRDWLSPTGVQLPKPGQDRLKTWAKWWDKSYQKLTRPQRQELLSWLDRLSLYDVEAIPGPSAAVGPAPGASSRPLTQELFTVILTSWKDDDEYLPDLEQVFLDSLAPCMTAEMALRLRSFADPSQAEQYRNELWECIPADYRDYLLDEADGDLGLAIETQSVQHQE